MTLSSDRRAGLMGGRFSTLDGLRGIAALLVMQMHAKWWFEGYYLQHAYLAVDFFFMLSGFVIAHAYGEKIKSGLSFRSFAAVRLIRLYPLYVLGIILTVALVIARDGPLTFGILAAATLWLPIFSYSNPSWFVPSSWSLFFEILVNAFYFQLSKDELTNRVLLAFCALGLGLLVYCANLFGSLDVGYRWSHAVGGFARVGFSFTVGLLLYKNRHVLRVPSFRYASLACIIAFATVVAIPTSKADTGWYDVLVVVLAFPLIIAVAQSHTVTSPSTAGFFDWLGRISYPLYITHAVLFGLVDELAEATGFGKIGLLPGIVIFAAVIALSSALDSYYDAPIRRHLKARFDRTSKKASTRTRTVVT